jgi:hypothetical protein
MGKLTPLAQPTPGAPLVTAKAEVKFG